MASCCFKVFSAARYPVCLRASIFNANQLSRLKVCKRSMAAGPSVPRLPSRLEWTVFKNETHFFITLGIIPVGLVIAYCNLFIGQAELSEIPEGYEPKYWEYHKHPISRFLARYCLTSIEREYEKQMHSINEEMKKKKVRRLEKRIKEVMSLRQDYKGWYYEPVNERRVVENKEYLDKYFYGGVQKLADPENRAINDETRP